MKRAYGLNLKKDICPIHRVILVYDERLGKLACPRKGCDFVDRRVGKTAMDPALDRRRTLQETRTAITTEDSEDIWGHVEW